MRNAIIPDEGSVRRSNGIRVREKRESRFSGERDTKAVNVHKNGDLAKYPPGNKTMLAPCRFVDTQLSANQLGPLVRKIQRLCWPSSATFVFLSAG